MREAIEVLLAFARFVVGDSGVDAAADDYRSRVNLITEFRLGDGRVLFRVSFEDKGFAVFVGRVDLLSDEYG